MVLLLETDFFDAVQLIVSALISTVAISWFLHTVSCVGWNISGKWADELYNAVILHQGKKHIVPTSFPSFPRVNQNVSVSSAVLKLETIFSEI